MGADLAIIKLDSTLDTNTKKIDVTSFDTLSSKTNFPETEGHNCYTVSN